MAGKNVQKWWMEMFLFDMFKIYGVFSVQENL